MQTTIYTCDRCGEQTTKRGKWRQGMGITLEFGGVYSITRNGSGGWLVENRSPDICEECQEKLTQSLLAAFETWKGSK